MPPWLQTVLMWFMRLMRGSRDWLTKLKKMGNVLAGNAMQSRWKYIAANYECFTYSSQE